MATTQQPEGVPQDRRTKALEEYRKKLVEHRELDAKLKKRTCPQMGKYYYERGGVQICGSLMLMVLNIVAYDFVLYCIITELSHTLVSLRSTTVSS